MTANLARRHAATGTAPDWLLKAIGGDDPAVSSAEFDITRASAKSARDFATATLEAWGLSELSFDMQLVVSELATNALRHAGGAQRLYVLRRTGGVVCAVLDPALEAPVPTEADELTESGRGLHLVAALTTAWGWSPTPSGGKLVWASFQTGPSPFQGESRSALTQLGSDLDPHLDPELETELETGAAVTFRDPR
ncbi:ATP-binding protein [Sinosporangium album]|nr:ATP-binding protein [Sinosporangium album]